MTKDLIVVLVIIVGAFEVDMSNWTPLVPNDMKLILTGSIVVLFSYNGFDVVDNLAEKSKRPQRDLPVGIISSLMVCVIMYFGVCLVITGMVPYHQYLWEDAPCVDVFVAKGLKCVSVLISFGGVVGLIMTLLVGLYVQSRLYLGLGMKRSLPAIVAKVHPTGHIPLHSQIWVGLVAIIFSGLLNVEVLSHGLSIGTLTENSVVSTCVVTLRWSDKSSTMVSEKRIFRISICSLATCVLYRYDASFIFITLADVVFVDFEAAAYQRQLHTAPPGFFCPGVSSVPCVSIFFNLLLFTQLHYEAWVRFVVLRLITIAIHAFYGQYRTNHSSITPTFYGLVVEETIGCFLHGIPNVVVKMLGPLFHLLV